MSDGSLLLLGFALIAAFAVTIPLLATRAAREMDALGRDGRIYGVVILLVFPLGLLLWLLDRRRYRPETEAGPTE